jgi:hypothetical protein
MVSPVEIDAGRVLSPHGTQFNATPALVRVSAFSLYGAHSYATSHRENDVASASAFPQGEGSCLCLAA